MNNVTLNSGSTAALRGKPNMVADIFSALRHLAEHGALTSNLVESSSAADPIIRKITGKGFFDYLQEKLFNKHGHERLARLVRIHTVRVKENMPQQSVKFFSSLAKKITNFVEKTPLLKQVFDSVRGLSGKASQIATQDAGVTTVAVTSPSKGGPAPQRR